jgi:hypothetical protein
MWIMCALHEDLYTCIIISQWVVHRMGNISDKICRENQNKFYVQLQNWCNLWDNVKKYGRARQARDDSIAKAWITMAIDTHSD